jgi:hypothetical protein
MVSRANFLCCPQKQPDARNRQGSVCSFSCERSHSDSDDDRCGSRDKILIDMSVPLKERHPNIGLAHPGPEHVAVKEVRGFATGPKKLAHAEINLF